MHAVCGVEYDIICQNEEYEDILDVIAPKKEDKDGKILEERTVPKPANVGVQLEICHNCIHVIRNVSSTPAAAAAPSDSADPMLIDDSTKETEDTTVMSAPAKGKKPRWLPAIAANKKNVSKIKKGNKGEPPKKKGSKGSSKFSIKERLTMAIKYENTVDGTGRKQQLAAEWGVNETTVRRWVRDKEKLREELNSGRGDKKRAYADPLRRIEHGLNLFHDANSHLSRDLRLPLTCKYK
jgi:cytochrome c5